MSVLDRSRPPHASLRPGQRGYQATSQRHTQLRRQPIWNGQALYVRLPVEVERVDADQQRVASSAEDAGDVAPALGALREADRIAPRGPTPVWIVVLHLEADVAEALVEPRLVVLRDRLSADDHRRWAAGAEMRRHPFQRPR